MGSAITTNTENQVSPESLNGTANMHITEIPFSGNFSQFFLTQISADHDSRVHETGQGKSCHPRPPRRQVTLLTPSLITARTAVKVRVDQLENRSRTCNSRLMGWPSLQGITGRAAEDLYTNGKQTTRTITFRRVSPAMNCVGSDLLTNSTLASALDSQCKDH